MGSDDAAGERRLVESARGGDREAFRLLAERYAPTLLRSASGWGCNRPAAEDLVQETLLEAWRSLARYDDSRPLLGWLLGILRHRYLKTTRKKSPALAADPLVEGAPQTSPSPAEQLLQRESAAEIRAAVARLPAAQREVIELRFFAQASLEEIAQVLNCPLGTVKSRLHFALEKLRQVHFD